MCESARSACVCVCALLEVSEEERVRVRTENGINQENEIMSMRESEIGIKQNWKVTKIWERADRESERARKILMKMNILWMVMSVKSQMCNSVKEEDWKVVFNH